MIHTQYKALVVDLDGTLIGRDERISPRVAEAVASVSGSLSISIASGREPADVLRFARQLGLTAPQISDNGAMMLDPVSGTALRAVPLGTARGRAIVDMLHRRGVDFIATHPAGAITDPTLMPEGSLTRVSALDVEEHVADELAVHFEREPDLQAVKVSLPYNGMWAVDITHAGVDKGTAARHLAQLLGVDPGQMIAVGDSYNDLPLLRACGRGVAMGHAPDELKAVADYVAPSVDDDGLAVAIEEFILPRLDAML